MRVPAIVASAALLVAACGGSKSGTPADSANKPAAIASAPTTTGTTDTISMMADGPGKFKFEPANLTIKPGDVVVFKGVSGIQHDVAFYPDSIPAGAADVLNKAIQDKPQDLATAMINDGQTASISFAGAPVGDYAFYCIPHATMGMHGKITVKQ